MPAIVETSLTTPQRNWRPVLASVSTDSAFAALASQATKPNATSLPGFLIVPKDSLVELMFFGTDADGETFEAAIATASAGASGNWYFGHIVTVSVILANALTGVANTTGGEPDDSSYFADTITRTDGDSSVKIVAGIADKRPARLIVDPHGAQGIVVKFKLGTAAGANALWRTH